MSKRKQDENEFEIYTKYPPTTSTRNTKDDEKPVDKWTTDEVVNWAEKIVDVKESSKLKTNKVNGNALLNSTVEELRTIGITYGPAKNLIEGIKKLIGPTQAVVLQGPKLLLSREQQDEVWKYTVQLQVDEYENRVSAILLQSQTTQDHRHVVTSLHAFRDNNEKVIPGFPRKHMRKVQPQKPLPKSDSDPLTLYLHQLQLTSTKGLQENIFHCIFKEPLGEKDVIYINHKADVIVLFDIVIPGTTAAPISAQIMNTMKVHLFGFAKFEETKYFSVPGEVQNMSVGSFVVSCSFIPGMSGGSVVCDGTGGVIGYSGGSIDGSDGSRFGAYAYPMSTLKEIIDQIDERCQLEEEKD